MQQISAGSPVARERAGFGAPPLPHEHGAWVMLYAPMVLAASAVWPARLLPLALLFMAVTGVFLARHAAALWLRRRGRAVSTRAPQENLTVWLVIYVAIMIAGGAPLLLVYNRWQLLLIAVGVALLFALHTTLQLWPARKRLDRSQWGEILGTGALTLTAPAAYVAVGGALDKTAFCLWAASTLYFSSGVFHVKMLLSAAKIKRELTHSDRLKLGRDNLLFHLLLTCGLSYFLWRFGVALSWPIVVAYVPAIVRAFWGTWRMSSQLPPLKIVGIAETVLSLWFVAWFATALK